MSRISTRSNSAKWTYPCGTDVILRVQDPRVHGVQPQSQPGTGSVLPERFGNLWLGAIQNGVTALQAPALPDPIAHAFGETLTPHSEFSPALTGDEPWRVG